MTVGAIAEDRANLLAEPETPSTPLTMFPPPYEDNPEVPDATSVDPFKELLKQAKASDFASYKFSHSTSDEAKNQPKAADIVAHLKLLRAFMVMKRKVTGTDIEDEASAKKWQVFVTNAVRRFIVFVSCLKHRELPLLPDLLRDEDKRYQEVAEGNLHYLTDLVPPLDVVMVWHSFLLNPRSFYDNFMRNDFYQFANLPLPLYLLNKAIDDDTFEYEPDEKAQLNYLRLLEPFLDRNRGNQTSDLRSYDATRSFNMYEYLVDVKCPNCSEIVIQDVPLTNVNNTGFADVGFLSRINTTLCRCKLDFPVVVNHDELRRRQLYSDLNADRVLPGIYKYFSSVLSHATIKDRDCYSVNDEIVSAFKDTVGEFKLQPLLSIVQKATKISDSAKALQMRLIFRNYLGMNLIHSTVHSDTVQVMELSEDLVGCVTRQYRFAEKMNKMDWLHSPLIDETLKESRSRYSRFFTLLTLHDQNRLLVPTLDIDLVWHTHQLSARYYFKDCLSSKWNTVVDHDDKVEQTRLDDSFEKTARLYKQQFQSDYALCFCWYCVGTRSKSSSKINKIFSTRKKADGAGQTAHHISTHNAIELQTRAAVKKRAQMEKRYEKQKDGDLPWQHSAEFPSAFVVATGIPIPAEHSSFYGDALCTTVRDYGATCSGVACGNGSCDGPNKPRGRLGGAGVGCASTGACGGGM